MRTLQRVAASAAVGLLICLAVLPGTARANSADVITSYEIDYVVNPSGVVSATETIQYSFAGSQRRGIVRDFTIREEDPDKPGMDLVYRYKNISVESPTGAASRFTQTEEGGSRSRDRTLRLQIGDPNRYVKSSETYVITYEVEGAMRSQASYDEFYWDAISDRDATVENVTITTEVPGGVQEANCSVARPGQRGPCNATVSDGKATFTAARVEPDEIMTLASKIGSGLVADNQPKWEPDASQLTPEQVRNGGIFAGIAGLVAVGSPLAAFAWWRRNGRDDRYVGVPPGTVPVGAVAGQVGKNDPKLQIPVAFSPPKIPVGEAGFVIDGKITGEEVAAVLVDLAVRGAIRVHGQDPRSYQIELLDPSKMQTPEDHAFLPAVFPGLQVGTVKDLSKQASLESAGDALANAIRGQVQQHGWFKRAPRGSGLTSTSKGLRIPGVVGFIVLFAFVFGGPLLGAISALGPIGIVLLLLAAPVLGSVLFVRYKLRPGVRSADGRAIADQAEGFRTYLATAEADQLEFEEGQDIFSKYLPWAIVFDLAQRWQRVCEQAMAMGRIPQTTPTWYDGAPGFYFNAGLLASSMNTAAAPPPPPPSSSFGGSGSGFGSSSSGFSGGGSFSGGGGGGGGVGSW